MSSFFSLAVDDSVHSRYQLQTFNTADGLPDPSVRTLLQSTDGYLWVGTERGLGRFDGFTWLTFTKRSHPNMVNDDCRAIAESSDGVLWVSTAGGLLSLKGDKLRRFTVADGLPVSSVTCLSAKRRIVWIGTGVGLFCVGDGETIVRGLAPQGTFFDDIHSICETVDGMLWIGSAGGAQLFDPINKRIINEWRPYPFHAERAVRNIVAARTGEVWAIADACLYQLRGKSWNRPNAIAGFEGASGRVLAVLSDGTVWYSRDPNVLFSWNGSTLKSNEAEVWLRGQSVYCMLEDRDGNRWFGLSDGLAKLSRRTADRYSSEFGLAHRNANSVLCRKDGSVWVGTERGVSRFDRNDETLARSAVTEFGIAKLPDKPLFRSERTPLQNVRSIAEDRLGVLWVGGREGVFRWFGQEFQRVVLPGEVRGNKVHVLAPESSGGMWIGTRLGLNRWIEGKITTFTQSAGLSSNEINAVCEDSGDVWIGTADSGVNLLTFEGKERVPRVRTWRETNGLANDVVFCVHVDGGGNAWIGTAAGLSIIRNGAAASVKVENGLPDQPVRQIIDDGFGRLWVGCSRGIYSVSIEELISCADGNRRTVAPRSFDHRDGAVDDLAGESGQPASGRESDGCLWFCSSEGVVVIDPARIPSEALAPEPRIERVVAGSTVVFDRLNAPAEPKPIVGLENRNLELRFGAPMFVGADRAIFKYRLSPGQTEWITTTERHVKYSQVPAGNHRFEVLARNKDGVWSATPGTVAILVAPQWHESVPLRITGGCAAALVLFAFARWRINESRKIHALESASQLARERERISREMHDDLGARLSQLALICETKDLPQNGPAARLAREAAQCLDDIVWSMSDASSSLEEFVVRFGSFAREYLSGWHKQLTLEFPDAFPPVPLSPEMQRNLLLTCKEALHNVVQHSGGQSVTIACAIQPDRWRLSISDDGKGIQTNQTGTGQGLRNMRQRVESIGGLFRIATGSEGTSIEIIMPSV